MNIITVENFPQSNEEYTALKRSGDALWVKSMTKELGLNDGKGYSNASVNNVLNGIYNNEEVFSIFRKLICARFRVEQDLLNPDTKLNEAIYKEMKLGIHVKNGKIKLKPVP